MFSSLSEAIVVVVMSTLFLIGGVDAANASTNVNLASVANVVGIGKAGVAVADGGLDGGGDVYASASLGATATWEGLTFSLGSSNALNALSDATLNLPAGNYATLSMLATGVDGHQAAQAFIVTYTDGTSVTLMQSLSDWHTPQNYAGESTAVTATYRLNANGAAETGAFHVYGYSLALDSAKTIKSLKLPANRHVVILAVSLTPQPAKANIAAAANVAVIGKSGAASVDGGLDAGGDVLSSTLLGTTANWAGMSFNLGAPGALDAVSNVTLSLPTGSYSLLSVLATAVDGNAPGQSFVLTYTDGTSTTFTQSMSDWHDPQNYAGESRAVTQAYRLSASGAIETGPFYVYGYTFAINSAKTVKSLKLPATRHVVVLAVNLTGSGSAAAAAPAIPTNVGAIAGSGKVTLNWSVSSGATSYNVKRATTNGGPYTRIDQPAAAAYVDNSVINGTDYYYVVSAVQAGVESGNSSQVSAIPSAPSTAEKSGPCGMQLGTSPVIFCDTFDVPAGIGNRSGDLNGNVWGVSRAQAVNFGQEVYNQWNSTLLEKCDGTMPRVLAPHDIIICDGQVREASNDNNSGVFDAGTVTSLAMYPKQPFDFAGRTGTVSFDVSNDTGGIHAAWPEFWMTDLPVPDPFNHFNSWEALPANGLAIRFAAAAPIGMYGACTNLNNSDKLRWTVDSAAVVRDYVLDDTNGYGRTAMTLTDLDCVIKSTGPGDMNHVELRISQDQIDVYATDAGVVATPATLKHIAVITNANLTLTRGFVWFEDVHYNADKGPSPSQREHTFSWDNVAFDGPFTYRDFSYDAPDNNVPSANGSLNLGKFAAANQTTTWDVPGIPANPKCAAVRVLFSFNEELHPNPTTLTVIVNGHSHTVPWPYPDQLEFSWRSFAVTVPVTDLVAGTNVVQLGANAAEVFSNVNIALGDVAGGVPVLPGADDAYP